MCKEPFRKDDGEEIFLFHMQSEPFHDAMFFTCREDGDSATCRIHHRTVKVGTWICVELFDEDARTTVEVAGMVKMLLLRNMEIYPSDYYDVDDEVSNPRYQWDFQEQKNPPFYIQFTVPCINRLRMEGTLPIHEVSMKQKDSVSYICNISSISKLWKVYPQDNEICIVSKIIRVEQ